MAQGFSQQYGLDDDEKFNLVEMLTIIRVMLVLTMCKGFRKWYMDVKNTFFTWRTKLGYMYREIERFREQRVLELCLQVNKVVYGLK